MNRGGGWVNKLKLRPTIKRCGAIRLVRKKHRRRRGRSPLNSKGQRCRAVRLRDRGGAMRVLTLTGANREGAQVVVVVPTERSTEAGPREGG